MSLAALSRFAAWQKMIRLISEFWF